MKLLLLTRLSISILTSEISGTGLVSAVIIIVDL